MVEPAQADTIAFADPAEESDYQASYALLVNPPASQQKVQLLIFSLIAFVAATFAQDSTKSLVELGMLLGVLFVHELGHVAGMRIFGYRDVKMFFIPFFGAAASGRKRGVERWKEGVVLLLGPVPGIIVGCILIFIDGPEWLRTLSIMMIALNGINLLPVAMLDGGQLFQIMLFSRHRHLEVAFSGITSALLVAVGILASLWFIAIIGGFMLLGLSHRARVLAAAKKLREEAPAISKFPEELDEAQRRLLYKTMWTALPPNWWKQWRGKPAPQAQMMGDILDRATQVAPDANASVSLGAVWLVALFASLVCLAEGIPNREQKPVPAVSVPAVSTADWRIAEHAAPAFTVEMPGPHVEMEPQDDGGSIVALVGDRTYMVGWSAGGELPWINVTSTALTKGNILLSEQRISETELRLAVERQGVRESYRLVATPAFGFIVYAVGTDADAQRFIDSFRARSAEVAPVK